MRVTKTAGNNIFIGLIFFVFYRIYLNSAAPSFNSDDSPETVLAQYLLGIQHPPGYPLNTLIGKIFSMLPAGSECFRANIMAVFFNIAAAFMIFLICRENIKNGKNDDTTGIFTGLIAAIAYLFSSSAWLQGIIAKGSIYSLNAFLVTTCFWAAFRMRKNIKYFYLLGFVYGLSMGNHWTSMAVTAPAFMYMLYLNRKMLTFRRVFAGLVFFLLGAGVYFFIFIRSMTGPSYAWGDIKSLNELLWLIKRAQYAGREGQHTFADTAGLIIYYLKNFSLKELPFFTGLLLIPGVYVMFRRERRRAVPLFLAYVFIVFSVAQFATPPENTQWLIKPYLVSSNIFAAVFTAYFIVYAAGFVTKVKKEYLLSGFTAVFFTVLVITNNPGYSRYFAGYDYARNISKSTEKGSLFFAEGDMNIGAALFETLVSGEDYVPVIPVVAQYGWYREQLKRNYGNRINLPPTKPNMREYLRDIIAANSGKKIYYSTAYTQEWAGGLNPVPEGIVFMIPVKNEPIVLSDIYFRIYSFRGFMEKGTSYDEFTQRLVADNYGAAFYGFGDKMRLMGRYDDGIKYYKKALNFSEKHGMYVNLGLLYYYTGRLDSAEESWRKAMEMNPEAPINYTNMAFIYIAKKDFSSAAMYVKKALSLDPGNSSALNLKEKLKEQGITF